MTLTANLTDPWSDEAVARELIAVLGSHDPIAFLETQIDDLTRDCYPFRLLSEAIDPLRIVYQKTILRSKLQRAQKLFSAFQETITQPHNVVANLLIQGNDSMFKKEISQRRQDGAKARVAQLM